MNQSPICLRLIASAAVAAALTACGGGGSDSGTTPFTPSAAAGLYEKTGGGVPATEVLVLDSGRVYAIYGMNSTTPVPAGGVIVADATTTGTGLASSNVHDFNLSSHTLSTGTGAGTYVAKTSISITVSYGAGTISTLSANYSNVYEQTPTLSALAGTYGGETGDLGGTKVTAVTLNAAGVLAGSTSNGCVYAGVLTPHAAGNVFDVTMNFQSGCTEAGNTLRGHAFVSNNVLYVVVVNGDLSRGVLFAGVKS
jgi:hypothetical protein